MGGRREEWVGGEERCGSGRGREVWEWEGKRGVGVGGEEGGEERCGRKKGGVGGREGKGGGEEGAGGGEEGAGGGEEGAGGGEEGAGGGRGGRRWETMCIHPFHLLADQLKWPAPLTVSVTLNTVSL